MSYHHKSGAQKRKEKAMRAEVKGQNTLQQHGFDVTEDSEGTDREKNQCSSVQPSAEEIIAPSHFDIAIEKLSIEDLAEIQEEVPRSKPDAAVKGSTDSLEIHDEALVAAETKSIVEVVGVDIGIFIKGDVPMHKGRSRRSC